MHGTTPGRDEILSSLRRKKNSAAPGWSGVTYVALKRLASCHDILVLLIQRAWREGIPPSWRRAIVLQFAKAGADGSDPADYRPIALTEHVAKLFFSVVQRRVSLHMSANGLWQTQKGFVEKVAGCIEHSTVTAEAMKDAKRSGRDICVTWLDLQNAFGSVTCELVVFALRWYQVDEAVVRIFLDYYKELYVFVRTKEWTTSGIRFMIGLFQGCTSSPTAFDTVFQLLLDSLCVPDIMRLGYSFQAGANRPEGPPRLLLAAFADDAEVVTRSVEGNQYVLRRADAFISWSRTMRAKPSKCFAWARRQGRVIDPTLFVAGAPVRPMSCEEGFKYLGRWINRTVTEVRSFDVLKTSFTTMLSLLDGCPLDGPRKAWGLEHVIHPAISWLLLIHDHTLTQISELDAVERRYLKRWWRIPRGGNATILFSGIDGRLGMRHKRLLTLWRQQQVIRMDLLRTSADPLTVGVYRVMREREASLKRTAFRPIQTLETKLARAEVESQVRPHRLGLGASSRDPSLRQRVTRGIRRDDVDTMRHHLQTLQIQGKWDA
jgi:hypothetical protein